MWAPLKIAPLRTIVRARTGDRFVLPLFSIPFFCRYGPYVFDYATKQVVKSHAGVIQILHRCSCQCSCFGWSRGEVNCTICIEAMADGNREVWCLVLFGQILPFLDYQPCAECGCVGRHGLDGDCTRDGLSWWDVACWMNRQDFYAMFSLSAFRRVLRTMLRMAWAH